MKAAFADKLGKEVSKIICDELGKIIIINNLLWEKWLGRVKAQIK